MTSMPEGEGGRSEAGGLDESLRRSERGFAREGAGEPSRARVLVVDDEPRLLETVRFILKDDHDVKTLTSAREALDRLLAGEHYDLVLCDLTMPGMTGVELLQRLSAERPDLTRRVVFMTGGAVTAAAAALLEDRATRCLEKPFRPGELLAFVRGEVATDFSG